MLELFYTKQFKKDLKLSNKRGKKLTKLNEIVFLIQNQETLPEKYRNHLLSGNYVGHWECHIEPDWLLIYLKTKHTLTLVRTGTHSDLF